ncbi:membrane associated rhomboid family serine protease [Catenuloplanes atrovinosus]|uniref:Membrane associated rhomboid family serine protease n=2 Tax=Catenuloplanes atrovinosus TaxID=137266 RepID=A0AAE4CD82_9ACTN|nr:membrane associated rhomboid family serine protease [Catenuloplanes atrovinosus]
MNEASVGHQCPECVAEGRRTQRPVRTAFGGSAAGRAGIVTTTLVGLNVLAAVLGVVLSGMNSLVGDGLFSGSSLVHYFGAVVGPSITVLSDGNAVFGAQPAYGTVFPGVWDGGYYRLFTAMFIHFGILHLLMNMWALWILGRQLEIALGPLRFLALYTLAGLGGNVAALLIDPGAISAGASTAIFGLFAALFVLLRRLGRDTSAVLPVLIVNLVITFVVPSISIAGHIGGLVVGGLVAAALAYAPQRRRGLIQGASLTLIFLILAALALTAS